MMFHLQTYIYFPVYKPSFPAEIPVEDTDTLRKAEPYLDFDRLDGHIVLTYQGQPILTEKYGDFIVDYWSYLVRAIEAFMQTGRGKMYLPEQPISITIKEQSPNWVLMTIGHQGKYGKWLLPKDELIKTLLDGAVRFFYSVSEAFSDTINQQYRFKDTYNECLELKKQYFGE